MPYKGVCFHEGKWLARISFGGKRQNLGHFGSQEEAARAYDAKAVQLFGSAAELNFPSEAIMPEVREIPVDGVVTGAQARVEYNPETIERYREPSKKGRMPPVIVFREPGTEIYHLGDGHYRLEAHRAEGLRTIKAEVRTGTRRDAVLFAVGANEEHGEPRRPKDKVKAVQIVLADDEWKNASDRWVADVCKVSHTFVAKVRSEFISKTNGDSKKSGTGNDSKANDSTSDSKDHEGAPAFSFRRGRDGREYATSTYSKTLCQRCKRVGPVVDCPDCLKVRDDREKKKKAKKKKAREQAKRQALYDKEGTELPPRCRDAFADPTLPGLIKDIQDIQSLFDTDAWIKLAGGLTSHYGFILIEKFAKHTQDALESVQLAVEALKAGVPHAVCPSCKGEETGSNGHCCKACRGHGHVPEHKWRELAGAK